MSKSVMYNFGKAPSISVPRSVFNRSHGHTTSFDEGKLIPILLDEVIPGDTFKCNLTSLVRMSTPLFPLMDNMYLESFFFFVPNRLIWSNWKRFCGERDPDPDSSIDYELPEFTTSEILEGEVADYMGLKTSESITACSLPLRAYNLIWNTWFRSQILQDSITVDTGNGPDTYSNYNTVRRINKKFDYFTSCLDAPQKGESVDLPLGTVAPCYGSGTMVLVDGSGGAGSRGGIWQEQIGSDYVLGVSTTLDQTAAGTAVGTPVELDSNVGLGLRGTGESGVYTDLSEATAATINELRQAFQIQKLLERDNRGGTRYQELVYSHFGVRVPDYRAQIPEFLGGGRRRINITPVQQTSEAGSTPQGHLAAYGIAAGSLNGFTKSFTEHGWIIGLVAVRADLRYQDGVDKMWTRSTRYDFYYPALANLGEQAVLNKEICLDASAANGDDVFGYNERWSEMRFKRSLITGAMRSEAASSLDAWHLAQDYDSAVPTLNSTFLEENAPMSRVLAAGYVNHFNADFYFDYKCVRPMPVFSVPGFIDHF